MSTKKSKIKYFTCCVFMFVSCQLPLVIKWVNLNCLKGTDHPLHTSFINLNCSFMYQIHLNYLGNYIPNAWTRETGCSVCDLDLLDLSAVKVRILCTGTFWVHLKGLVISEAKWLLRAILRFTTFRNIFMHVL